MRRHNWQTKKLLECDVDFVIMNLLREKFVVEIDGYKYDITFGKNRKHEIGSSMSLYPSPSMCSYELINKGFREGKWYIVTDEDLQGEEKEAVNKFMKDLKKKEEEEFIEHMNRVIKEYEER